MTHKIQSAPGARTPEAPTEKNNNQKDYSILEWFSQQGARFVKVAAWNDAKAKSPGKSPFEKSWQNKPLTLKEVLPHIKSGGNVGLLCGKHSSGLCLLDIDDRLNDFLEYFPGLMDAPIIQRADAPNRGKIILKISGDIPQNKKWHDHDLEFLGTGNQGVIPPSIHPSGAAYELRNADKPAMEYSGARIMKVGQDWTEAESDIESPATDQSPLPDNRGRLSRNTRDFIDYGAGPHTRNQRLFTAACDLNGCKYTQGEAESMLLPVWSSMSKDEKEAQATIKSAYSQARQPANPHAFDTWKTNSKNPQAESVSLDEPETQIFSDGFNDETMRPRYKVISGAYHSVDYRDDQPIAHPLCNFDARIVEEIAKDDGQEITRQLKLKGQLATGQRLAEIDINAADFNSMKWIIQKWGLKAIIHAGQSNADKLREAIQWHSKEARSRTEYTHTGWREIDGKRVYLTTNGAIGLENVSVSLEGNLKRYAMPNNLDGINLQEAVKKSISLLDIAPRSVTWALWACMYLAPLADIAPIDFVLWIFAETGSLKSTLCAMFLCHYGEFTYKTLPEGWATTDNALEKAIFTIKDAPIVIDDFAPQSSGMEAQAQEKRAARLVRAIGNHSPRNRMNADTTLRAGYPSRGLVISTGEQLPSGQSVIARILPVEVLRDSVNTDLLTLAQKESRYLSQAMTGYLLWLAKNWDGIRSDFQERLSKLRDEMRGGYHLRTPEMFANLLMGIEYGLQYAIETNAITKSEAKKLLENAKAEIRLLAESQSDHVKDELPTQKFINALESLIAQKKFYIAAEDGTASAGDTWLGWSDDDFVYVQGETAYNAVSDFLRKEGSPPLLKQPSLYKMLARQELIMPVGTKNTISLRNQNRMHRVIRFYKNKVNFTELTTPSP